MGKKDLSNKTLVDTIAACLWALYNLLVSKYSLMVWNVDCSKQFFKYCSFE